MYTEADLERYTQTLLHGTQVEAVDIGFKLISELRRLRGEMKAVRDDLDWLIQPEAYVSKGYLKVKEEEMP